ncbi:MAG: amidase [Gemmataceae bacterium]|nr:amidase [Gemmataceae bacterium]
MPALDPDDCFLPATEMAARVRAGKVNPEDLVAAIEKQVAARDKQVNAFIYTDFGAAKKVAAMQSALLKQHPKGMPAGPLFGLPVAVKDDLFTAGFPTTMGSRTLPREPAKLDDLIVYRLREAGAIIVGKTHEPEFGHKGVTNNVMGPNGTRIETATPWDVTKTAGGSSGGSAAAVAGGMAFLALGTDIGGSVRIPAACCGAVGFKPTFGLIPRVPSGNAFTLWVAAPITRTVADVALAMSVLAGHDQRDRFGYPAPPKEAWDVAKKPQNLRIRWCTSPTGCPVDAEVADLCLKATRALAKAVGGKLDEDKEILPRKEANEILDALRAAVAAGALAEFKYYSGAKDRKALAAAFAKLSPSFASFVGPAGGFTLDEYFASQAAITTFCEGPGAALFAKHDIVATPTIAVPPFDKALDLGPDAINGEKIDPHLEWLFTWPYNLTGDPAVSVPCGLTKAGLPVGLQLAGPRGSDVLVLRAAQVVEDAVGGRTLRPAFKGGK